MARRSPEDWYRLLEAQGWEDYAGLAKRLGAPFGTVAAGAKRAKEWAESRGIANGAALQSAGTDRKESGQKRSQEVIGERFGLTAKQLRLLELVIDGARVEDAANEVGVSRTTGYAWLDLVNVKVARDRMEHDRDEAVAAVIKAASMDAANHVRKVVKGDENTNPERLRAALSVLDRSGHPKTERVEHAGKVDTGAPLGGALDLTPEELRAQLQCYEGGG